ncbi:TonB-dependent siderophore receptor [Neisseria chenwenguii]|uniref:TonB-dependent siderophore receptor n=1 Tax=Neisseria chenwenguii TaxID=1853278 RepID=A0A220S3J9_9NEIS|nr:TonB-dependent siderophore receptor [Neisseria chenwenguii]ASK27903.1 TonB-dependent siderophore receptor [Neisseria chenwenguii]ROV56240.1 TonB-dependent siderophore receptor [Neisseria chenwenguii]
MNKTFTRSLIAAAVFSIYPPAFAADAQNAAAPESAELATVNVVGSINKLQGVPFRQAKSAVNINAETLSEEGVEKADELGRYQAGFTSQPYGSDTNTNWFRVRGAEASQSVDGAPSIAYGFFTPQTEMFGVEAVEVTKGADAITYGAANSGGLINYVSKRPHKNQVSKGEIKAQIGTKSQRGIAADYTGRLNADDSLRYRIVGSYRNGKGEWHGTGSETYYFAPSLAWDISDRTKLNLLASYQKDVGTPSSNFLPIEGSLIPFEGKTISRSTNLGDPTVDRERNKQYSLGYEFSHDFGKGVSFSSNYRYNHVDNRHLGVFANYSALGAGGIGTRDAVFNDGTAKSHSFDNRLTWKTETDAVKNTLIAGIDYRRQNVNAVYDSWGNTVTPGSFNVFAPNYGISVTPKGTQTALKARQLGFYLQDSMRIFDKVQLTGGIRHDRAENEELSSAQKVKKNHTSYSSSLMYLAPYGISPYIAYNESFRLPNGLSNGQKLYDPNITKQIEAGVKYMPSWLDGKMSLAAFKAKDEGALVFDGTSGTTASSADPVKRKGIEFQADANLTDNINAAVAYTYLSSVTQGSNGDVRNPLAPKHTLSARAAYAFNQGALNGLKVGAGVRYIGKSQNVTSVWAPYSGASVPSATVFDLFARYDFARNWTAQVNVDNLTDKKYVAGCNYWCYYGQGRSVLGSVSYKF